MFFVTDSLEEELQHYHVHTVNSKFVFNHQSLVDVQGEKLNIAKLEQTPEA